MVKQEILSQSLNRRVCFSGSSVGLEIPRFGNVNKNPVHFATCFVLKYFLVRSEDELSVERIAYFVYCGQISPV